MKMTLSLCVRHFRLVSATSSRSLYRNGYWYVSSRGAASSTNAAKKAPAFFKQTAQNVAKGLAVEVRSVLELAGVLRDRDISPSTELTNEETELIAEELGRGRQYALWQDEIVEAASLTGKRRSPVVSVMGHVEEKLQLLLE
jgi:hypothetical protein